VRSISQKGRQESAPKKIPATDAIFDQVNQIKQAAEAADDVLRLSMDAQATGTMGPFARGGQNRVQVHAADHACAPEATVTPVGIFLPTMGELFVYGVMSQVTRAGLVDRLAEWWEIVRERCAHITTLVLNLDHGPENHSRRTQFRQRLVAFVQPYHLTVRLVYYPPSHSKYKPIEGCWGILENHWKGTWLDSLDPVLQCARTMTWRGNPPVVALGTATYQTGVTLTKDTMETVESQLQRLPVLGKWFGDIVAPPLALRDT
jgi:Rhodopirellula transposase DDE domain